MKLRVAFVDDHTLFVEGCKKLLEGEYDVVGTYSDARAFLLDFPQLKVDVVVLDVSMPHLNGLDTAREVLRRKETPYAELHLDDPSLGDDALIDAMLAHPVLIQRPIVVSPLGTRLCRPSEAVLDLLPSPQQGPFAKEDGEVVIDAQGNRVV